MAATFAQQVSAAAHEHVAQANPLTVAQGERLLDHLLQRAPGTLLDIGCGPAFLATALIQQHPTRVTAVDPNPIFLARAQATLAGIEPTGAIDFICGPFADQGFSGRFDAVVCMGASQAIGSPREALQQCRERLLDDGIVIFAELAWRREPEPAFLEFLGVPATFYWRREQGQEVLTEAGLSQIAEIETSTRAFQDYEDAILQGRLAFAETLPAGERKALIEQSRQWYEMFQRYGGATLGFIAYVATVK